MKGLKIFAMAAIVAMSMAVTAPRAHAQLNIQVDIGAQPVCPYGYFDYAPYRCAPFGYYGPAWFSNGIFIGAGPWFHGPVGFHGYIDRRFDPRYGYHGSFPARGEHANWGQHRGWEHNFHGNYERHEVRRDNGRHNGENKDHGKPHGDKRDHDHPRHD